MIACKSNLKQLYIGLSAYADSKGAYCSGAFDWKRDGAVTEVGWVADVVNNGILAGKMLCPSNADYINCTYDTLLNETDVSTFSCLSKKSGSPAGTNPDGSAKVNPCRKLLGDYPASSGPMPADEARAFVEEAIYNRGYNTNYAASWFLVRTAVTLDAHGNLRNSGSQLWAVKPNGTSLYDRTAESSACRRQQGSFQPDSIFGRCRANRQVSFGSSRQSSAVVPCCSRSRTGQSANRIWKFRRFRLGNIRRSQWLVGRLESSITRLSAIWHSAQGKLQFSFRRWERSSRLSRHQPR